ncbi:MAG: acyl-CoA thioester hydrolase/BAAT C-terminal domain-containing protein [Bacteroidota bacterium]
MRRAVLLSSLALMVGLWGCDQGGENGSDLVDFETVFAPPTDVELSAIRADWASRDVSAQQVAVVAEGAIDLRFDVSAQVRIVSHRVAGVTHYGAVIIPDGLAEGAPIMVYSHGGDEGTSVDEAVQVASVLGTEVGRFVYVVPSFRDEPLAYGEQTFQSDGPASPWDFDVDDALALIEVALQLEPRADGEQIGVLGFSRGSAVALLMAVRDPRIDLVVDYFGPTDFFSPFSQDLMRNALDGEPRDLPGVDVLTQEYLFPLRDGQLNEAEFRLQLIRRSPLYFAADFPSVQVHHGTADDTVPVTESDRLAEAIEALGGAAPPFAYFRYEGGEHFPTDLVGSLSRTAAFIVQTFPTG